MIKNKKCKLSISSRILSLGLIITVCLYIGYLCNHTEMLQTESTQTHYYRATLTETTERKCLTNNVVWRQRIELDDNGVIDSVKLKVVDVPEEISGDLELSLRTKDGAVCYSKRISGEELINGTYNMSSGYIEITLSNIKTKVKKNDMLFLECVTHDMVDTPSLLVCKRENVDTLQIGDKQVKGYFLPFEYEMTTKVQFYWIAILIVILYLILIYSILYQNNYLIRIANICVLVIPIIVLSYSSWINENMAFLQTKYGFINIFILYLIFFALQSIAGRKVGGVFFLVCGVIVALGNYYLLQFRDQPLMITDIFSIGTAMTVASNYIFQIDFKVLTELIITIFLIGVILQSNYDCTVQKKQLNKKKIYLIRGIALSSSVIILFFICYFANMELSGWDISESYRKYGWVYTNTKLCRSYWNTAPKGYDSENVKQFINNETVEKKISFNKSPENLIVIMDESFSDLSVLGECETNQEVMPFFNSLKNNDFVEKGWLDVHVLGGGTATTEWELLSSGNSAFMNIGSLTPYNFLERSNSQYNYTNLCSVAKESGYKTIAMHPFYGRSYSRDKVYPELGFDDFLSLDNYYQGAKYIRGWISDETDVDEVIKQYENKGEEKLFLFNVTMQNHGGYTSPMEKYNIYYGDGKSDELNSYFSLVNETDQALKKLLEYFSMVEEPTMIVFFGDHQPSLPDMFYDGILKTTAPSDLQNEMKYVTPYLIWSNYERTPLCKPYMNAGYLGTIIKAEAGLELNFWDQFLLNVIEKYPVIGNYGIFDRNYKFFEYSNLEASDEEYLKQMKYAQYYWWTYKE